MPNIDYCTRCDRVVNERYDPGCYDLFGVCLCKACREWARDEAKSSANTRPLSPHSILSR
jgi:hypothetical protein